MKIVLYGIGRGCAYVRKQVLATTKIIGYSDSFADIKSYLGCQFVKPQEIKTLNVDFVIVTLIDREQAWQICDWLSKECGIAQEKIIPYFCCCNTELFINKISGIDLNRIENLVIGNSHAQKGYLESAFPKPTVNLSTPGSDLYIMYHTLKKCIPMFHGLKKVIVDLFDYTIFNIDASRSKWAEHLYISGAILNSRNIRKNPIIETDMFDNEKDALSFFLRNVNLIDISKKELMSRLFYNDDLFYVGNVVEDTWHHIAEGQELNAELLYYRAKSNEHPETIEENVELLDGIIKLLGKDVDIIFTLIPQYIQMERLYEVMNDKWKAIFYEKLNWILNKYENVSFYNFKNKVEISGNHFFYLDPIHLNTAGGYAMTSLLCSEIYG